MRIKYFAASPLYSDILIEAIMDTERGLSFTEKNRNTKQTLS
mgnify:FL=1